MDTTLLVRPSTVNSMNASTKKLKENMRLDFEVPTASTGSSNSALANSQHSSKRRADRINKLILSSPDVQRLVLESPEMERILNLSNFNCANQMISSDNATIYNTKDVSEDQEAFVLGFVSALKRVQSADKSKNVVDSKNSTLTELVTLTSASTITPPTIPSSYSYVQHPSSVALTAPGVITHSSSLNKLPPVPTNALPSTLAPPTASVAPPTCSSPPLSSAPSSRSKLSPAPAPPAKQFIKDMMIKEEQPVPMSMDDNMVVTSSPINMECQERFKTDRKRARNRVAAQKCRNRKIERIHMLQRKADILKSQNQEHHLTLTTLKSDISSLQSQILLHTEVGCKML